MPLKDRYAGLLRDVWSVTSFCAFGRASSVSVFSVFFFAASLAPASANGVRRKAPLVAHLRSSPLTSAINALRRRDEVSQAV
jgi:hypothetical protein